MERRRKSDMGEQEAYTELMKRRSNAIRLQMAELVLGVTNRETLESLEEIEDNE